MQSDYVMLYKWSFNAVFQMVSWAIASTFH